MKTHLLIAIAVVNLLPLSADAQSVAQPPLISVTGSAEVKVAPDEIFLRIGVNTRNENLEAAKKQNDERISRALSFLKTSGVPSKDVQTDFMSIEPQYDDTVSRPKQEIYVVRKSIEVKLTKVEDFERVLTGLLNSGVNNVHGIEFRTSQVRKHRDAARAAAVRAAREKADALASELGVKRGKVHSIDASEWGGSSAASFSGLRYAGAMQNSVQNAGSITEMDSTSLSVGQISVSASVNVSFVIE